MKSVTQIVDLGNPESCRAFLKAIEIKQDDGTVSNITTLYQADGKALLIDDASDEQVMQIARDLSVNLPGRRK